MYCLRRNTRSLLKILRGKKLGVRAPKLARENVTLCWQSWPQHAHDTDVVVPRELEQIQHAHHMTENTQSVPPQDNKENALWLIALLAGGVVAIIVFHTKSWSRRQGFEEATVSCERPAPPQQSPTPQHSRATFVME